MKVYGWIGFAPRGETHPTRPGARQARYVVAARSRAAAARAGGYDRPSQMFNLSTTGNAQEILAANSEPGTVFWTWLDSDKDWKRL